MTFKPKKRPSPTGSLHPRNPHRGRYDLLQLGKSCPELLGHLIQSPHGETTIDFSDANAVLLLNKALLAHYYKVVNWQIPDGYLCPPIPGRADYIHYIADLLPDKPSEPDKPIEPLAEDSLPDATKNNRVTVLDVGTGANCIYPIIGSQSYGWNFVASDIDPVALNTARVIVKSNRNLSKRVSLRLQQDPRAIFKDIITPTDRFDLTLCNPPFHASRAEAEAANQRKVNNLAKTKSSKLTGNSPQQDKPHKTAATTRNFGGQNTELWCPGGEIDFLTRMVKESSNYAEQVYYFTSLVSKAENIKPVKNLLLKVGAKQVKVVEMSQGQKISRLLAWSFLSEEQRLQWS